MSRRGAAELSDPTESSDTIKVLLNTFAIDVDHTGSDSSACLPRYSGAFAHGQNSHGSIASVLTLEQVAQADQPNAQIQVLREKMNDPEVPRP
jgi:hypothetical protein